jgi:hypothetical protein
MGFSIEDKALIVDNTLSRLSFFTIRFFLKLEYSPRMNELIKNFDTVIFYE